MEKDDISNLYDLVEGSKEVLLLDGDTDINFLYSEAYNESANITVWKNKISNVFVVKLNQSMTAKSVVEQLIGVLLHGDHKYITYKGEHKLTSIRASAYRIAKNNDCKVNVSVQLGMVYMSLKDNHYDIEGEVGELQVGENKFIPISKYSSIANFRSALQCYANTNDRKYTTKVMGLQLRVTRIDEQATTFDSLDRQKLFLEKLMWDLPFPVNYNEYKDVKRNTLKSNLYRLSNNCISFKGDTITKHKCKLARFEGYFVVLVYGKEVYKTPVAGYDDNTEREIINRILNTHGFKYEDMV